MGAELELLADDVLDDDAFKTVELPYDARDVVVAFVLMLVDEDLDDELLETTDGACWVNTGREIELEVDVLTTVGTLDGGPVAPLVLVYWGAVGAEDADDEDIEEDRDVKIEEVEEDEVVEEDEAVLELEDTLMTDEDTGLSADDEATTMDDVDEDVDDDELKIVVKEELDGIRSKVEPGVGELDAKERLDDEPEN